MRRKHRIAMFVLALAALGAGAAAAQETGTPVFRAPYRAFKTSEVGANLSDPNSGDLALEGFYSYGSGKNDFGIRAGFLDTGDRTRGLVGANFRRRIFGYTESFPLDGAVTAGFGINFGGGADAAFLVPVGVSLGRRVDLEGSKTSFVPYVQPVLVPTFGSGNSELNLALGLGVDIKFGGQVDLRISGGIGDIDGVAVGLAWVH